MLNRTATKIAAGDFRQDLFYLKFKTNYTAFKSMTDAYPLS